MASVLTSFEEEARLHPDAAALTFSGQQWSYTQLDRRADGIAARLRDAGVGAESLVAVYLDRKPDLVASLLGVWKAGGAYLPIDPTSPRQRVESTLEDAKAEFVLTEKDLIASLPATSAQLMCVDDSSCAGAARGPRCSEVATAVEPDSKQLAYVIYTSGSTGRPKGAEITHGALHNVIEAIGKDVALCPRDVVMASATIAFDIANLEMFLPLVAGASVHLLEREFVGDGGKLIEAMERDHISLVLGTPTSWRLVLEAGWRGDPNLQLIVGGEVLPVALARSLAGMTRAVWNHYGPTETAICATRERIAADVEEVTLGWPIENTRIHVLGQEKGGELHSVPIGDVGEIYIGGAGVGRGYRNRADLSERAFVADPFAESSETRMYKTGDLGRLLPDGRLDFQGRVDHQVKLRGFRIELEEIEAAMCAFEGVHAAVVAVAKYGPGDERLVGYFLGKASSTVSDLRSFLRQRLPYYMVPGELILLDSLPMTANGKVDRQALEAIRVKLASGVVEESEEPADDLEARLRAIWRKVLRVKTIGADDDFFDLGGHSLLATRMFAEIEKLTGLRLPLSVLIQNPTVSRLANYLREQPETGWPGLVPMRGQGSRPPLFIAHGLGSNLLLFRGLVEALGGEQPVYGIQLAASPDATLYDLKLEAFAERAVREICAVDPVGPYYLAGHSLGGLLVFEIASQLRRQGKEVGLVALLDCRLPGSAPEAAASGAAVSRLRTEAGDVWLRWRKKFSRLRSGGLVRTTWRKVIYNRLQFKIRLLRLTYSEGSFRPQIFGLDPYIALFAERYRSVPMDVEATLFAAEDEAAPESEALSWSRLFSGRFHVQKVPGSHQTIFDSPHVAVLASELTKRLEPLQPTQHSDAACARRNPSPQPMISSELECNRG